MEQHNLPRIRLMSPGAVYLSAFANIYPHAACALFRPAQNWMLLQSDAPKGREAQELQEFAFLVLPF